MRIAIVDNWPYRLGLTRRKDMTRSDTSHLNQGGQLPDWYRLISTLKAALTRCCQEEENTCGECLCLLLERSYRG